MHRLPNSTELTINPIAGFEMDSRDPEGDNSPINVDLSSFGGDFGGDLAAGIATFPPLPQSPPVSPRLPKESSKGFLSSFKSRTIAEPEPRLHIRQVRDDGEAYPTGSSSVSKIYHLRKNPGSSPELSLVSSADVALKNQNPGLDTTAPELPRQISPHTTEDNVSLRRREKTFRNPLGRSKSRRGSSTHSKPDALRTRSEVRSPSLEQPPKTAPIMSDWPSSEMKLLKPLKSKERRGKSAERAIASESEDNVSEVRAPTKEKSGFIHGSKNVVSKAKSGGGHFLTRLGKIGRSASNHDKEKDIPDSEYKLKIINLPLVEQTRKTRISKDLSNCRDKTEYWMPSLPWRCIDYLNLNCEAEGLYRVPGSGPQVKKWQRRFDTELDVDLLDENDLYDPNNIGSMLKSWLRDLPTELIPGSIQIKLAAEIEKDNPEYQKIGQQAPQKLRDALSELPPFNYYLLFAITCHLSLLLSHKEKNKMDLNNLSICIGPCLKMDRWLFNYLVGDWRHCWQGCFTEKQFLEGERLYEQSLNDSSLTVDASQHVSVEDRTVSSSGSLRSRGGAHEDNKSISQDDHRRQVIEPHRSNQATPQRPSPPAFETHRPQTSAERSYKNGGFRDTHGRSHSDHANQPTPPRSLIDLPHPSRG